MTANKTLIVGKWEFIKAETHNGVEWEVTNHVKNMTWQFHPNYISPTKTIGVIVESASKAAPAELNYTFSTLDNLLRIEVYTDPITRIKDETDIYDVRLAEEKSDTETPIITIELINQIGCPPPYLRYTLQQID